MQIRSEPVTVYREFCAKRHWQHAEKARKAAILSQDTCLCVAQLLRWFSLLKAGHGASPVSGTGVVEAVCGLFFSSSGMKERGCLMKRTSLGECKRVIGESKSECESKSEIESIIKSKCKSKSESERKIKIIALFLAAAMLVGTVACVSRPQESLSGQTVAGESVAVESVTVESATGDSATGDSATEGSGAGDSVTGDSATEGSATVESATEGSGTGESVTEDREGNPVTLPDKIERVISMGPSNTEIISALGLADMIVAADEYSSNVAGLRGEIPLFDMMAPDAERMIALEPDVVFVAGMSAFGSLDQYGAIKDAGACVFYVPTSESVAAITEDIKAISVALGVREKGEGIVAEMLAEIDRMRQIGETITDRKTVYFELSAPPYLISFGANSFLFELVEIIGAENIFSERESWIAVSEEVIFDVNPDVILTSVNYIDDPVGDIVSRPGWNSIAAVQKGDVYYIDTDASNRPSNNIVLALREMAAAIYPGVFES